MLDLDGHPVPVNADRELARVAKERGWEVRTTEGRRIGKVDDLLVDRQAMRVKYLDVELDRDVATWLEQALAAGVDMELPDPSCYPLLSQLLRDGKISMAAIDGAVARILRAKALGTPLAEIKAYLDMYGQHGEGRIQQLQYVIDKTDATIKELEAKRQQIDASLAEMRLINATSRKALAKKLGQSPDLA